MYSDETQTTDFETPKTSRPKAKKWFQRWWGRLILVFLAIFLIIAAALIFYVAKTISLVKSGELTPQEIFPRSLTGDLPTLATDDDPNWGPKEAKVVMVEFSDFQCPFCKEVKPVLEQIRRDYGDKVRFIYRDFPITETHPEALLAAVAANCAHEQGKFWEMHDKIFDNQDNLSEASLKTYAVQIGLNNIQFGTCLKSQKYLPEIEDDMKAGYAAGVEATPTIFINGIKMRGALPLATYERIIISELSR